MHQPEQIHVLDGGKKDFIFPPELLGAIRDGKAVIFAGAGISTENKDIYPHSFFDNVAFELNIHPSECPGFPDTMSLLCAQPNGRRKLLSMIKERIDYVFTFPNTDFLSRRFHRELSTIFLFDTIITTNWDDFFERECGAVPYVIPEDFSLWDMPGRKVFKIHGSINNLGSIIAEKKDYAKCYRDLSRGALGGHLKLLLATKTIIYIGYSLSDPDFQKIHGLLKKSMGDTFPHSYIVTPNEEAAKKANKQNMTPIITTGDHFLSKLKEILISEKLMIADKTLGDIQEALRQINGFHMDFTEGLDMRAYPATFMTVCYQDGLLDALYRIKQRRNTGEYSDPDKVTGTVASYNKLRSLAEKEKKYGDAAYIEGYRDGLSLLILPQESWKDYLKLFYIFGAEIQPTESDEYKNMLSQAETVHPACYKYCVETTKNSDGKLVTHAPFIFSREFGGGAIQSSSPHKATHSGKSAKSAPKKGVQS